MSQINYTNEMKEQDLLWLTREEDVKKMAELQASICRNAIENNVDKSFYIDFESTESVAYIFDTDDELYEYQTTGKTNKDGYGNCKQLIKAIMNITLENVSKGGIK